MSDIQSHFCWIMLCQKFANAIQVSIVAHTPYRRSWRIWKRNWITTHIPLWCIWPTVQWRFVRGQGLTESPSTTCSLINDSRWNWKSEAPLDRTKRASLDVIYEHYQAALQPSIEQKLSTESNSLQELVDFDRSGRGGEEKRCHVNLYKQVPATDSNVRVCVSIDPQVDHAVHQHINCWRSKTFQFSPRTTPQCNADDPTSNSSTAHNHPQTYEPQFAICVILPTRCRWSTSRGECQLSLSRQSFSVSLLMLSMDWWFLSFTKRRHISWKESIRRNNCSDFCLNYKGLPFKSCEF